MLLSGRPIANEPGIPGFLSFRPQKVKLTGCRVTIHLLVPDLLVALPEPLQEPSVIFGA